MAKFLQKEYRLDIQGGHAGEVIHTGAMVTDTGINEGGAVSMEARALIFGASENGVTLPTGATTASQIVGFTRRTVAAMNTADQELVYKTDDLVSYLALGRIRVAVRGGCERGANVHVHVKGDHVGQVSGVAVSDGTDDTVELKGVKFTEKKSDGEIVVIDIRVLGLEG